MRPGRVAVLAALPALALAGGLQDTTPVVAGVVTAQSVQVARVITDGRPQPVALAVVAVPARRAAAPAALRRPAPRVASAPVAGPRPSTAPTPTTAAPVVPRVQATVTDGYPYRDDTAGDLDPWGFTKRQCVSYAAWRLAEEGRPLDNARDGWGSALHWDDVARRRGRAVTSRPAVGAVAQWEAGESSPLYGPGSSVANGSFAAGAYGHVAWVTKVYADGSVLVADYNGSEERGFATMRVQAPRFLRL